MSAKRVPAAWAAMVDDYLTSLAASGQRPETIKLRRSCLTRMARGLGCDPRAVTGELLVAWFGRQAHWAVETRRSYRSAARGFFSWAYQTGRVSVYLGDELPKILQPKASPRPAPDHAWRSALMAADARTTVMLRLAGEAGLRRAEVAQVHTRDLLDSVDGSQLLVHGKGGKQRVVPISDSLADAIRQGAAGHMGRGESSVKPPGGSAAISSSASAYASGSGSGDPFESTAGMPARGWLFPAWPDSGHLSANYVGKLVANALPDGYTMHTLRHRFSCRAYRGTRNLRAVQVLLGHASIATTERYVAVDDVEIRAAMVAAVGD